uniref:FAD-dependent oxidoreductase n=1 Tax=Cupriavidus yeoncheonensis TaxID=1462994 RepID=UPI003F497947
MRLVSASEAAQRTYDLVVIGGGLTGALVARRVARAGRRVLILEAGPGAAASYTGYQQYLNNYYRALAKIPEAPFPSNPNAPEPTVLDPTQIQPGHPDTNGYFVQLGPLPFRSTYATYLGGTTLHWLGTSLRMLPEDFALRSRFGVASDWPISYADLAPWYAEAERQIGVSANVDEQAYGGVTFPPGYVYPMHGLPPSVVDQRLAGDLAGMRFDIDGEQHPLDVIGTPASRNGIPNEAFDGGKGYRPVGAVHNPAVGHRCQGNSSCVPICPVQAKFNALKILDSIDSGQVDMVVQAVVSRLAIDPDNGRITGVTFKYYPDLSAPGYQTFGVQGSLYVLAAHAVENAKLLLASGAAKSSGQVGRNLMDHTELLTWGLMREPVWPFRGPVATSGIEGMRYGTFRRHSAAFRIEIGNDGWSWPEETPESDVQAMVDGGNLYGKVLRERMTTLVTRQMRFGILVEQLPEWSNRVTIDPTWQDQLGSFRPVISYNLSDYTRAGFALARHVSDLIFRRCGIEDHSVYDPADPGFFNYRGRGYVFQGAGHYMGTHRMGSSPRDSVVGPNQRTWDHANLYLVGCGNMVTGATSNPTLTASALTLWAAEHIVADLGR